MEIHFEIGDRCLLKCRHCSSLASEQGEVMQYSEQEMCDFLSKIKEEKEVFLTGGEPLLYPDLDKLIGKINSRVNNLTLGLFTTGIIKNSEKVKAISSQYAKKLSEQGLKICYLSLYSFEKTGHDWMTGLQGSFELLKESINNLQTAGVEIRFNSVVTKKNILEFDKIVEYAKKLGATEVRLLKLIRHGRACNCWDELGITDEEYRMLVSEIAKKEKELRITASGVIDILPCRYLYNITGCPAGEKLLYVTNEGNIAPCASVKKKDMYIIGNIQDMDIYEKVKAYSFKANGRMLCCVD